MVLPSSNSNAVSRSGSIICATPRGSLLLASHRRTNQPTERERASSIVVREGKSSSDPVGIDNRLLQSPKGSTRRQLPSVTKEEKTSEEVVAVNGKKVHHRMNEGNYLTMPSVGFAEMVSRDSFGTVDPAIIESMKLASQSGSTGSAVTLGLANLKSKIVSVLRSNNEPTINSSLQRKHRNSMSLSSSTSPSSRSASGRRALHKHNGTGSADMILSQLAESHSSDRSSVHNSPRSSRSSVLLVESKAAEGSLAVSGGFSSSAGFASFTASPSTAAAIAAAAAVKSLGKEALPSIPITITIPVAKLPLSYDNNSRSNDNNSSSNDNNKDSKDERIESEQLNVHHVS